MIRALTGALVGLAVLLAGWWFVAAQLAGRAVDGVVAELRADGWGVELADLTRAGFPWRIDITARDLSLTAPGGRVGLQLPQLQAHALSVNPTRVILTLPEEQVIILPGQQLRLQADRPEGMMRLGIAADLPLRDASLQSGLITLLSDGGWRMGAAQLLVALQARPDEAARYDLLAELREVTLPALAGDGARADAAGMLRLDAVIGFDRTLSPLDNAQIESVSLRGLQAEWGPAAVSFAGDLVADGDGFASGSVELELRNWPLLLAALAEAGLLGPEQAAQLRAILGFAASGDNSLRAPLVLAGGQVLLGGLVPIGPAPRLR